MGYVGLHRRDEPISRPITTKAIGLKVSSVENRMLGSLMQDESGMLSKIRLCNPPVILFVYRKPKRSLLIDSF